jgi:hypothetical protein
MFAHLLYGTSSVIHGNLKFDARIAGTFGQKVSIEINEGPSFSAVIENSLNNENLGVGAGQIALTVPASMTEADLIYELRGLHDFNILARVDFLMDQDKKPVSDGSMTVVPELPSTLLDPPAGGLQQHLESRIRILGWSERDLEAKDKPIGLLFPFESEPVRKRPDSSPKEDWYGRFQVGVAFLHKGEDKRVFSEQNCKLDLVREHIYFALKSFDHPALCGAIGGENDKPEVFGYSNKLKDEAANKVFESAQLRVVGTYQMTFAQPLEPAGVPFRFKGAGIGLWVEPLTDHLGLGGGEIKDSVIIYPKPQEA